MSLCDIIVFYFEPVFMKDVIAERTDIIVGLFLTGCSDYGVGRSGINSFIQIRKTRVVYFRVAVSLQCLFQNRPKERRGCSIGAERQTPFCFPKLFHNIRRYGIRYGDRLDGERIEAFQNCSCGIPKIEKYCNSSSTALGALTEDVKQPAVGFSLI